MVNQLNLSEIAGLHNRLIDYAIIAELRGREDVCRGIRFAASLMVPIINRAANKDLSLSRGVEV